MAMCFSAVGVRFLSYIRNNFVSLPFNFVSPGRFQKQRQAADASTFGNDECTVLAPGTFARDVSSPSPSRQSLVASKFPRVVLVR